MKDDLLDLASPVSPIDLPEFSEGAHIHKRNGTCYLAYGYGYPEKVAYAMSRQIEGPCAWPQSSTFGVH